MTKVYETIKELRLQIEELKDDRFTLNFAWDFELDKMYGRYKGCANFTYIKDCHEQIVKNDCLVLCLEEKLRCLEEGEQYNGSLDCLDCTLDWQGEDEIGEVAMRKEITKKELEISDSYYWLWDLRQNEGQNKAEIENAQAELEKQKAELTNLEDKFNLFLSKRSQKEADLLEKIREQVNLIDKERSKYLDGTSHWNNTWTDEKHEAFVRAVTDARAMILELDDKRKTVIA